MKILLTGGAGFIGSTLAARLLDRGDQLAIVDNLNSFYDPAIKKGNLRAVRAKGSFEFYENDILDWPAMQTVFHHCRPELVIHLAAYAGVRPSLANPALYTAVNVTGTTHLLELSHRYHVGKFVFGSSSSVYGVSSRVPFREDDPVQRPISPYAVTKRAGELLCYNYHHNYKMPICCLRFFTVFGPRQRPEMAIHKFASLITEGETVPVYAYGYSQRDYTYVDDIIDGIIAALDANVDFEIFNLGDSHPVELNSLIRLLEAALGQPAKIRKLPEQSGDVPVTFADISKARSLLGYNPKVSLEEGIARFVEWFRKKRESPAAAESVAR